MAKASLVAIFVAVGLVHCVAGNNFSLQKLFAYNKMIADLFCEGNQICQK